MAVVSTLSNHYKTEVLRANIDFRNGGNVFRMLLMDSAFTFDKTIHATYTDVIGNEIAGGAGYIVGGQAMANVAIEEDDINHRGRVTWDDIQWDASGGAIGPTGSAVLYDDTSADDTVIGCIDFDADYTVSDGSSLQLQNVAVNNS